jgi:tetratricopeptide (TPR) repeat protein
MTENHVTLRQALFETRQGTPEKALAMWREILQRDVHNGPAHHVSGLLCMKMEQFADAEYHFRRAVSAQPDNWDYHKDLGMAIESRKGIQASIDHFRRAILDCRTNPDMYVILAGQLIAKGAYMAAQDAAEAALRIDHTYVDAWIERSRCQVELKRFKSAGASLGMARFLDPDCDPSPTPDWARAYSFLWSAPPRRPKLGASRVAVCMTGACEVLQYTSHNLKTHLLDRLEGHDLFIVARDDGHAHLAERLNPTELMVGLDQPMPEDRFQLAHARSGVNLPLQGMLQHYNAMKRVSQLMDTVDAAYDAVIYIRPTAWLKQPFPDVSRLDLSVVHTPHQDTRGGVNDRFAVGSFHDMDVYLNQFDSIVQNPERLANGPEKGLMRHLIQSGVIPILDPRLEMRVARLDHGRMVLQAPDWMAPAAPVAARL